MTYPVRAAEHVKYEYFILDMMMQQDKLLQLCIFEFLNNYMSAMRLQIFVVILK